MKKFLVRHAIPLLIWGFFLIYLTEYLRDGYVVVRAGNAGLFYQDAESSKSILVGLLSVAVVATVWDVVLTIKNRNAPPRFEEPVGDSSINNQT